MQLSVTDGLTLEGQDTTLGLGLVSDVRVLLAHADHDSLVTGSADNGGEDLRGEEERRQDEQQDPRMTSLDSRPWVRRLRRTVGG